MTFFEYILVIFVSILCPKGHSCAKKNTWIGLVLGQNLDVLKDDKQRMTPTMCNIYDRIYMTKVKHPSFTPCTNSLSLSLSLR